MPNLLPHTLRILTMIIICLVLATYSVQAETSRTISLTGIGEISASPDIARITSGVVSTGKTAANALSENTAAMAKVIAGLKSAGIKPSDIQTTGFSVNPNYFYDPKNRQKPPKIIGYKVNNQVHVTVRKLGNLGDILDKIITLGANQINGISFGLDNTEVLQDEARKRAIKDAYRKAKIYTTATDTHLGPVLTLTEVLIRNPQPRFAARSLALRAESAPVPIEAGEKSVRIQVNITWAMK